MCPLRCVCWCMMLALASAASLPLDQNDVLIQENDLIIKENDLVIEENDLAVQENELADQAFEDNNIERNNEAEDSKGSSKEEGQDSRGNSKEEGDSRDNSKEEGEDSKDSNKEEKEDSSDSSKEREDSRDRSKEGEDSRDGSKEEGEIPVNERYPHAVQFGSTCGGSIISPTWVLTAGHCAMSNFGYEVLAGTNSTWSGGVYGDGKRLVIHPLFSVGPHFLSVEKYNIKQIAARWDFLLIELEEPLPLDGKIMAAATLNDEEDIPVGLEVGYAGYGASEQGGYMRSTMHGMELEVLADAECQQLVEYNPEDMLCARGRAPRYDSACNGDSGSGLVDARGRLLGVVSWVEDDSVDCRPGTKVYFARVSAARDWIRRVTGV